MIWVDHQAKAFAVFCQAVECQITMNQNGAQNMAIWKMPINHELLTARAKNTFAEFIGIEFTEIGDDYLTATLPVDHRTKQPLGFLNGGVSAALAEAVASTAANYCVDQSVCYCVGLDINANHLRPAVSGVVTAT